MNYHLHDNGWTIIVDDFNLLDATQEDINLTSDLLKSNTLVVFKKQKLTIPEELKIGYMFGNVTSEYAPGTNEWQAEVADEVADPNGHITRVTGALNEHGQPGTAGYVDAMDWHNNQPHRIHLGKQKGPLVWLYGVKGTAGSRTTYTNSILGYKDLDDATKETIKDLKGIYYSAGDFREPVAGGKESDTNLLTPNVVNRHISGELGIYHSHLQLERFEGMTREESLPLSEKLQNFLTQDKYCYHHDWEDGDIVIADQWFGIHKRWRFEKIKERLLHRMVFGYVR